MCFLCGPDATTAPTPRAARHSSPLCGTARAPHPRLASDGSPGGRSRGWRVRHPLHFALRRTGDREAGGGARAPKAAAKRLPLRRRRLHAVAALPCPSPRHRPVVRAFSANGADRIRGPAGLGWKSSPPATPGPRSRAAPGSARGGVTSQGSGAGQTRGRRWATPVVPVKGERRGADLPGPSRAHFHGL